MDIPAFSKQSQNDKKTNKLFFDRLKHKPPRDLDLIFHEAHDHAFESIDCLHCANCCKTTSPIFYQRDIERAAKHLRIKPGQFIDRYLKVDDEKDFVLKSSPCTFLGSDNYCSIYEARPQACREYPHTNRKKMFQILDLTFRNTMVCPAVLDIINKVKQNLKIQ